MGRKQKPEHLAWLHGSGSRPATSNGTSVDALMAVLNGNQGDQAGSSADKPLRMPNAPRYFDDVARRLWHDLGKLLLETGMLAEQDLSTFELLCVSYSSWQQAAAELAEHGALIEGTRGTFVRNPAALQLRDSAALFMRLSDRFGLSPRAAEKLGLSVPSG